MSIHLKTKIYDNNLSYIPKNVCLRGFQPGPTQPSLYGLRRWLRGGLKFWIQEREGLYHQCSENNVKGAD